MSTNISRDEWLKALGDAVKPCDPDALTMAEIGQMFNIDKQAAYRKVKQLVASGRAVVTFKVSTTANGFMKRMPAYKLVKDAARPAARRR